MVTPGRRRDIASGQGRVCLSWSSVPTNCCNCSRNYGPPYVVCLGSFSARCRERRHSLHSSNSAETLQHRRWHNAWPLLQSCVTGSGVYALMEFWVKLHRWRHWHTLEKSYVANVETLANSGLKLSRSLERCVILACTRAALSLLVVFLTLASTLIFL